MNVPIPRAAPVLLAALLAACASPSPAPVLLTLPSDVGSPGAAAAAVAASAPLLAVRRVGIPEYLVARRVRYRAEAATLAEWPNTYWAERIEIGISREFVAALRLQLPDWSLCDTNCGERPPALNLQVDLTPMDYLRSARKLQARARIALSGAGANPKSLVVRELIYEIPAGADTPQAQAQAMAALIQQVAGATASMVREARP